jgi:hypothetical protein
MARLLAIVALTVCTLTVSPAWAQSPPQALFGADGAGGNPSNLYILSPTTGAIVSTVGPIGFAVTGLAVHPTTGVLYGSTGNKSPTAPGTLITIDKTTGQGTVVGAFGIAAQTMADLTFTSDGTLYGWLVPSDDLYTIDVTTGQATIVGDSGLVDQAGAGLAANAAGTIFFAGLQGLGPLLRTIDRTTGQPSTIAPVTVAPDQLVAALAFDSAGVLFGVALTQRGGAASLITINTSTGQATVLGNTVNRLDAIAFDSVHAIPTVSEVALVGLALLLASTALYQIRRQRPGARPI